MRRWRLMALLGAVGAACATPAHADESLRLRLESALGVDTNITRSEGDVRRSGPVARGVLDVAQAIRADALRLGVNYQAGGRKFIDNAGEDGLFQRLSGQVGVAAASHLHVVISGQVLDRTTRDPLLPRDYTRVGGGPTLATRLGAVQLSLGAQFDRLVFKPDGDFSATGAQGTFGLALRHRAVQLDLRAGAGQRLFDGRARVSTGVSNDGPIIEAGAERRVDQSLNAGLGLRYEGDLLARLDYAHLSNSSSSFGGGFTRQLLRGSLTSALSAAWVVSLRLDVQRVAYDDPQFISRKAFIDDENRSSAVLRLEHPLVDQFSLVGHLGAWFSPFGDGPEYARYTALAGLAANLDDAR